MYNNDYESQVKELTFDNKTDLEMFSDDFTGIIEQLQKFVGFLEMSEEMAHDVHKAMKILSKKARKLEHKQYHDVIKMKKFTSRHNNQY